MDIEDLRALWDERDRRYREGLKRRALDPREADAVRANRLAECELLAVGAVRAAARAEAWRWIAPSLA